MKVALISCTKLKQDYECSAYEMYQPSELFKKAFAYTDSKDYDEIFILSAKYGLLNLGKTIQPYEQTLNNMPAEEVKNWSYDIAVQLFNWIKVEEVDFYAGSQYRKYLLPLLEKFGVKCNVPLQGKGIGQQLKFYKENTL